MGPYWYCWWKKSCTSWGWQLLPLFTGFYTSQVVVWDFFHQQYLGYMGVSENGGTPKSSILIGFSIINHPFWGTPSFGNAHIGPKVWAPKASQISFNKLSYFTSLNLDFPWNKGISLPESYLLGCEVAIIWLEAIGFWLVLAEIMHLIWDVF